LRAALDRVRALAGLDLDEFADDLVTLGGGEPGDRGALGVDPETRWPARAVFGIGRRHRFATEPKPSILGAFLAEMPEKRIDSRLRLFRQGSPFAGPVARPDGP
jgi:hypothetical protein